MSNVLYNKMRNPFELKRHKTSSFDGVLYLITLKLENDDVIWKQRIYWLCSFILTCIDFQVSCTTSVMLDKPHRQAAWDHTVSYWIFLGRVNNFGCNMCDLSVMSSLKTARTLVVVGSDETSQEISLQFAPVTRLPEFLANGKCLRLNLVL